MLELIVRVLQSVSARNAVRPIGYTANRDTLESKRDTVFSKIQIDSRFSKISILFLLNDVTMFYEITVS